MRDHLSVCDQSVSGIGKESEHTLHLCDVEDLLSVAVHVISGTYALVQHKWTLFYHYFLSLSQSQLPSKVSEIFILRIQLNQRSRSQRSTELVQKI